jgi:hypothetical protein
MAETRSAIPVTQALTVGDRAFVGMDTYTDPNKLQDGLCQRISNLMLQGGSLVPRRGFQGITTTSSNSFWESLPVKSGRNLAASAVLVANDVSNNTLFVKHDINHTDPLPIPMSAGGTQTFSNIQANLVRMTQLGRYVYVAPGPAATGTSNYPLRIDTKIPSKKLTGVTVGLNKLTYASHGLSIGDVVVFVSGTQPSGTSLNFPYYVSHVAGNDFYISTGLPSTVTASYSHLTFAAGTTVTLVTSFKGETIPTATGLITTAPIAELNPFVVRDIQASAYTTVTTNLTLSNSANLLTNGDFGSNTGTSPTGWTQFTSGGNYVTVYASAGTRPIPSVGNIAEFDEGALSNVFPGLYQEITCPTETTTIYGGSTIVEPACLYAAQVRITNYISTTGDLSQYNNRGVTVRLKARTSGGADIAGATAVTVLKPIPTSNRNSFSTYTLYGDFRAFKDQMVSGRIQIELQNITDNGNGPNSIYVDVVSLYALPCAPATKSTDTSVDTDTKLVKVYATKINSTATAPSIGGFLKNRHFYYDVSATTNNWQNQEFISIKFKHNPAYESIAPTFTIGLQNGSATTITWGGEGLYNPDQQWMTFSLNAFPKASRDNVKAVYIRCNGDYLKEVATVGDPKPPIAANDIVFYIGKLVYNGELQNGGKYEYAFTRWKAAPSYTTTTSAITFQQKPPYTVSYVVTFTGGGSANINGKFGTTSLAVDQPVVFSTTGTLPTGITAGTTYYVKTITSTVVTIAATVGGTAITLTGSPTGVNTMTLGFAADANVLETFYGGVESPLSKISSPIETSNAESRLRINLSGDFRDSAGDGYTHLLVYRRNTSTFTDGLFRLIAQIDVYPSTPVLVNSSSNVTLESGATQSQIYLIDNVGDTELLFDGPQGKTGSLFHNGKDFFPQGAETVAVHQSRLWMSLNNTLYASWLLDNNNEYNIHTTLVPVLNEPYLAMKGASFDVSARYDNEPIVSLVPFSGEGLSKNNSSSNALLVLRNNSILPVTGNDASSFSILGFVQEAGAGCIAPNCAQTVLGRVWWLSNSGIMQYTNGLPQPVSQQLDRLVNARTHNPILSPSGTALTVSQSVQQNASSVVFDNKFIFSSSQPGGTYLDTFYVFDFKMNGWSEWQFPTFGLGTPPSIRSMYVLNTAVDAPQLFVASSGGHIYQFTGTQDKWTASSSLLSFNWAVLSRQYGQTYAQGMPYYANNKVSQLDIHVQTDSAQTITWKIYNQTQPALVSPLFNPWSSGEFSSTATYALAAGNKSLAIRNIDRYMRGTAYSLQLSGSSLVDPNTFKIYAWMLHVSEGGIKRSN